MEIDSSEIIAFGAHLCKAEKEACESCDADFEVDA